MKTIITIITILITVAIHAFPLFVIIKNGNFKKGLFLTWELVVCWGAILFALPLTFLWFGKTEIVKDYFPEMIAMPLLVYLFTGWINGGIIAGIGITIHKLQKRRAKN